MLVGDSLNLPGSSKIVQKRGKKSLNFDINLVDSVSESPNNEFKIS